MEANRYQIEKHSNMTYFLFEGGANMKAHSKDGFDFLSQVINYFETKEDKINVKIWENGLSLFEAEVFRKIVDNHNKEIIYKEAVNCCKQVADLTKKP